jgi:hypothetical protein
MGQPVRWISAGEDARVSATPAWLAGKLLVGNLEEF